METGDDQGRLPASAAKDRAVTVGRTSAVDEEARMSAEENGDDGDTVDIVAHYGDDMADETGSSGGSKGKGKGKAVVSTPLQRLDIALGVLTAEDRAAEAAVVWTAYEPPAQMTELYGEGGDALVADVVDRSVANIRARIREEAERKRRSAEIERLKEEAAKAAEEQEEEERKRKEAEREEAAAQASAARAAGVSADGTALSAASSSSSSAELGGIATPTTSESEPETAAAEGSKAIPASGSAPTAPSIPNLMPTYWVPAADPTSPSGVRMTQIYPSARYGPDKPVAAAAPSTAAAAPSSGAKKLSRFGLKRLFHRHERGESSSSAAGALARFAADVVNAGRVDVGYHAGPSSARPQQHQGLKVLLPVHGVVSSSPPPPPQPAAVVAGLVRADAPVVRTPSAASRNKGKAPLAAAARAKTPPPPPEPEVLVECVSCLDELPSSTMVAVTCGHSYCGACFSRLVAAACENEAQWPPKCCLTRVPLEAVRARVAEGTKLRKRLEARAVEWAVPVTDRVYCSARGCARFLGPDTIDLAARLARCPRRGTRKPKADGSDDDDDDDEEEDLHDDPDADQHEPTCTLCRGPAHPSAENCPQDRDLQRAEELAAELGWRRCGRCGVLVEHREACQHMTCRCGNEFCYVCGVGPWKSCECTAEQLTSLKEAAQIRYAARLAREKKEEDEVREALRLVEEFEREEARKAELLRIERLRAEREDRKRRWREAVQREAERRTEVLRKHEELRDRVLVRLHDAQITASVATRELELRGVREGTDAELEAMKTTRVERLLELKRNMEEDVRREEKATRLEYAARVEAERDMETEYEEELRKLYGLPPMGKNKEEGGAGEDDSVKGPAIEDDSDVKSTPQSRLSSATKGKQRALDVPHSISEEPLCTLAAIATTVRQLEAQAVVHRAVVSLRRRSDAQHSAWRRETEARLDALRRAVGETHAARAAQLERDVAALEERARAEGVAAAGRVAADRRWMREIVAERERMLLEAEAEELARGGADVDALAPDWDDDDADLDAALAAAGQEPPKAAVTVDDADGNGWSPLRGVDGGSEASHGYVDENDIWDAAYEAVDEGEEGDADAGWGPPAAWQWNFAALNNNNNRASTATLSVAPSAHSSRATVGVGSARSHEQDIAV